MEVIKAFMSRPSSLLKSEISAHSCTFSASGFKITWSALHLAWLLLNKGWKNMTTCLRQQKFLSQSCFLRHSLPTPGVDNKEEHKSHRKSSQINPGPFLPEVYTLNVDNMDAEETEGAEAEEPNRLRSGMWGNKCVYTGFFLVEKEAQWRSAKSSAASFINKWPKIKKNKKTKSL